MQSSPHIGWLLVGHGTRNATGRAEFLEVAAKIEERQNGTGQTFSVEACFLELAEPTVAQGLERLAARGVLQVMAVPLLLFSAGHAKDDVPDAVRHGAERLGLEIVGQAEALEFHPRLLDLSRQRIEQAMAGRSTSDTLLLLVGRGSSDPTAIAAVQAYTRRLADSLGMPGETAFVAAAQPTLSDKLAESAARSPRRVVVLPHLLFTGDVFTEIQSRVAAINEAHRSTDWLLASYLGPHECVVDAIMDRAKAVY